MPLLDGTKLGVCCFWSRLVSCGVCVFYGLDLLVGAGECRRIGFEFHDCCQPCRMCLDEGSRWLHRIERRCCLRLEHRFRCVEQRFHLAANAVGGTRRHITMIAIGLPKFALRCDLGECLLSSEHTSELQSLMRIMYA